MRVVAFRWLADKRIPVVANFVAFVDEMEKVAFVEIVELVAVGRNQMVAFVVVEWKTVIIF